MATNSDINNSCTNDFSVSRANSGGSVIYTLSNTSNTASSAAQQLIQVAGTTADDAFTSWSISGSTIWSAGLDNSDSDAWKLSQNSTLGTNDCITCSTAGSVNKPLTPAFLAYQASDQTNATGNNTAYLLGFTTALTEVFDQQSNFSVGGSSVAATFTAPITGRYRFTACSSLGNLGSTTHTFRGRILTSNRNIQFNNNAPVGASVTTNSVIGCALCDMDAADTATFDVLVTGQGATTVTVTGGSDLVTYVSGSLIC